MQTYLVGTGIVCFRVEALSPRLAIESLKFQILRAERDIYNPRFGQSLITALKEGRLNFIVFDAARTTILAGELNRNVGGGSISEYQEPATRELADTLRSLIPDALYFQLPCTNCSCGHC